jgi:hypothetical protein
VPARRARLLLATLVTLVSAHAQAAPALGAHLLLSHGEGDGVTPARSAALATDAAGSALLVLSGGYNGNDATPTDIYGNRFRRVGGRVAYGNEYGDRFDTKAYVALPAKGGEGHVLTVDKPANAAGEITIPFVEIRHATALAGFAARAVPAAAEVASDTVTTTGPATLIAVWWGDGGVKRMQATPGDGFTTIDSYVQLPDNSGVQCAVAWRQVEAAGTYRVHWTSTPVQGAVLWLFAFQ